MFVFSFPFFTLLFDLVSCSYKIERYFKLIYPYNASNWNTGYSGSGGVSSGQS